MELKEKIKHNENIDIHNMSIRIMYIWLTGSPMAEDMTIDEAMNTVVSAFSNSDKNNSVVKYIEEDHNVDAFKTMVRKANDLRFDLLGCTMALYEDDELRDLVDEHAIKRSKK